MLIYVAATWIMASSIQYLEPINDGCNIHFAGDYQTIFVADTTCNDLAKEINYKIKENR